jgi:hypothetical protein
MPEDTSNEREYRQVWFLFVFAQVTYMAAWSSILCYVTSGMVRSADEMPIAVWVSTMGLLTLYQTFVSAQARSIYVRCHACVRDRVDEKLWRGAGFRVLNGYSPTATTVYQLLDSGSWHTIILVAMNISSSLISGVLYSIPAIRDMLQIPSGYNGNETWCILSFVYSSSVLLTAASHAFGAAVGRCSAGLAARFALGVVFYATWSVGWFFFWGYFVMRPWLQSGAWVYIALVESGLFVVLWACLVWHKRACGLHNDYLYLWERENTCGLGSSGTWLYGLGSAAWFLFWGYFTLRPWLDSGLWALLAVGESAAFTLLWVYRTRPGHASLRDAYQPLGRTAEPQKVDRDIGCISVPQKVEKPPARTAEGEAMHNFGNEHCIAAGVHMLVLLATILVIALESVDIDSHYKTYSFWLDRKKSKLQQVDQDAPVLLDYCVRPNSLPVMKWWCVLAWSFASVCYHTISTIRIKKHGPIRRVLAYISYYADSISLVFVAGVSATVSLVAMPRADRGDETWTRWMLLGVLCCIGVPVIFVLRGISDVTTSESAKPSNTKLLQQIANDKWIEYAISATMMHVIVNCIGGIVSSHELVLLCGYLAVSMILVQLMEVSIVRMEQCNTGKSAALSVVHRIECERAFVALSFFSKLTLTIALCAPIAISDAMAKGSFVLNIEPILCS